MSDLSFDVIVVGAGPGGSSATTLMAENGLNVLMIDQERFPRDKVCGDAISGKCMEALKTLGLHESFRTQESLSTWGITISGPAGDQIEIPFKLDQRGDIPPGIVCRREQFDHILFERALRAGAHFQCATVTDLAREDEKVIGVHAKVEKQTVRYSAPIVIGADGAYSAVARSLGLNQMDENHYCAGIRAYFNGVSGFNNGQFIEIHFVEESIPGYFWMFPLPDGRANVGVGLLSSVIKKNDVKLKVLLDEMIKHPRFKSRFAGAIQEGPIKGWGLPLGSKPRKMAGDGWMLLGDAASLIDPFTGEGIGNAMTSGICAAKWAHRGHQNQEFSASFLRSYEEEILTSLQNEFQISKTLQRFANRKWLLNAVIRKASKSESVSKAITSMFDDMTARRKMTSPVFYLKLLFS